MQVSRLSRRGFTLIEFLVTLALVAIVAGLAFPPLQRTVYRSQVMGEVRKATNLIQITRLEAIRRGFPAVVEPLPDSGEMIGFVDIHGVAETDPPDGVFNPIDGLPPRQTDYAVRRIVLAAGMSFAEPGGDTGLDSVDGFDNPAPLPDDKAIFAVDGSVEAAGAFRLRDRRDNFFETRVAPAATGKVQIRKWDNGLDANWDGSHWYAEGEVERAWRWN